MNDKQLALFLTVADEGSFSKAETISYISKQAMLRQINALENEVGISLLNRSPGGVTLTPAGQEFYQGAKELLELRKSVLARCHGTQPIAPVIRIGQVEHQALLHPVNDAFQNKYPDIKLQKVIHPNHSGEYRVSNNIIDVGETFYTPRLSTANYAYTPLTDMPYLVAMAHDHPLAAQTKISPAELTAFPTYIFPLMIKEGYRKELEALFQKHSATEHLLQGEDVDRQVEVAFRCGTSNSLLLTANPFVTEIPELTVRPLDTDWSEEYGIIYRPNPSPIIRKYINLAVAVYGKH